MRSEWVDRDRIGASLRLDPGFHLMGHPLDLQHTLSIDKIADAVPHFSEPDTTSDELIYIDISSIDAQHGIVRNPKQLRYDELPKRARTVVRSGDVLVSTVRPDRGSIAMVPGHLDGALASSAFVALRPRRMPGSAIWAWLRSPDIRRLIASQSTGVTYPTVRQGVILACPIPVSDGKRFLELDRQIREIIDTAFTLDSSGKGDNLSEEFGVEVEEIHHTWFYVRSDLLTPERLDPEAYHCDTRDLSTALRARGLRVVALGDLATITIGTPTERGSGPTAIPVLRPSNIRSGTVEMDEIQDAIPKRSVAPLEKGDVLVVTVGPSAGDSGVVPTKAQGRTYSNSLALLRLREGAEIVPEYLSLYLRSDIGRHFLAKYRQSTMVQRISVSGLSEVPVVVPSIEVQRRILEAMATPVRESMQALSRLDDLALQLIEVFKAETWQ